jgi:hypothetical protein
MHPLSARGPPEFLNVQKRPDDWTTDERRKVQGTIYLTPTIIRRVRREDRALSVVSVRHEESGGEPLVVFMNEEQAETFRANTGGYPTSEGFEVGTVDVEGLKAILAVWGFPRVALWGPEPSSRSCFPTGLSRAPDLSL